MKKERGKRFIAIYLTSNIIIRKLLSEQLRF